MDAPKQKRTDEVESETHDAPSPNPTAANERTGEAGGGFSSPSTSTSTSTTTPRPQAPSPSPASALLADHLPEEEPGTGGDKQRPREPSSSSSADLHARSARALPPSLHTAQNDSSECLDSLSAPETATEAMTEAEILAQSMRNVNLAIEPQQQSGRRGWNPWGGALTSQSHSRGAEATVVDSGVSETSNSGGAKIRDVGPGGAGMGERGKGSDKHAFGNGDEDKGFQGAENSADFETTEVNPSGAQTTVVGSETTAVDSGGVETTEVGPGGAEREDAVNWAVEAEQEEAPAFYGDESHYDYHGYLMALHPEVLMMGHQGAIAYTHPAVASSSTHHYFRAPAHYSTTPNWAPASSSTHNFGAPASSSTHNNFLAPAHSSAATNWAPASSSTHNVASRSRTPSTTGSPRSADSFVHELMKAAIDEVEEPAPPRNKTRLCWRWMQSGGHCPLGNRCCFAHGVGEQVTWSPGQVARRLQAMQLGMFKTKLCEQWIRYGNCDYGLACTHAHGEHELVVHDYEGPM